MVKLGLVHYNFPGDLETFLDYAAQTGFGYVELQATDIWAKGAAYEEAVNQARSVKLMLDEREMTASAVAAQNDFLVPTEQEMSYQVQRLEQVGNLAKIVGTNILRVDGGWAKEGVAKEQWFDLMLEGFSRSRGFAEAEGLLMALDNHGLVTNDAEVQIALFQQLETDCIGANLDTMNYRWAGHSLETVNEFYAKIAPYVLHCHLKDGRNSLSEYEGTALGEGELDLKWAAKCLQDAGYDGAWCVEFEGKTDPAEGYRKGLEWVKQNVK